MIDLNALLDIEKLGARGEGVSRGPHGLIFTPYALPGERIRAELDGERGKLVEVLTPSPNRVAALCPHFTQCGGCAVQTLAEPAYRAWKGGLVADALRNAGVDAEVAPLVAAWGAGRRRATFHSRNDQRGEPHVGFMQARSHRIFELDACPILAPEMAAALLAARRVAEILKSLDKPLDLVVTASLNGLDLDLRGCGQLDFSLEQTLIAAAQNLDLARISNHGLVLTERRAPRISIGRARVAPPPGAFLQATAAGEEDLARLVLDAVGGAKKTADLFCGLGAFALRLAEKAEVSAPRATRARSPPACAGRAKHPACGKSRANAAICSTVRCSPANWRLSTPSCSIPARRRRGAGARVGEKRCCNPRRRILQPPDFCARRQNPDRRGLCFGACDAG